MTLNPVLGAGSAGAHEVEAVGVDVEPDLVGGSLQRPVEAGFGTGLEGEVGNIATVRTDEMVVVLSERFRFR